MTSSSKLRQRPRTRASRVVPILRAGDSYIAYVPPNEEVRPFLNGMEIYRAEFWRRQPDWLLCYYKAKPIP